MAAASRCASDRYAVLVRDVGRRVGRALGVGPAVQVADPVVGDHGASAVGLLGGEEDSTVAAPQSPAGGRECLSTAAHLLLGKAESFAAAVAVMVPVLMALALELACPQAAAVAAVAAAQRPL